MGAAWEASRRCPACRSFIKRHSERSVVIACPFCGAVVRLGADAGADAEVARQVLPLAAVPGLPVGRWADVDFAAERVQLLGVAMLAADGVQAPGPAGLAGSARPAAPVEALAFARAGDRLLVLLRGADRVEVLRPGAASLADASDAPALAVTAVAGELAWPLTPGSRLWLRGRPAPRSAAAPAPASVSFAGSSQALALEHVAMIGAGALAEALGDPLPEPAAPSPSPRAHKAPPVAAPAFDSAPFDSAALGSEPFDSASGGGTSISMRDLARGLAYFAVLELLSVPLTVADTVGLAVFQSIMGLVGGLIVTLVVIARRLTVFGGMATGGLVYLAIGWAISSTLLEPDYRPDFDMILGPFLGLCLVKGVIGGFFVGHSIGGRQFL